MWSAAWCDLHLKPLRDPGWPTASEISLSEKWSPACLLIISLDYKCNMLTVSRALTSTGITDNTAYCAAIWNDEIIITSCWNGSKASSQWGQASIQYIRKISSFYVQIMAQIPPNNRKILLKLVEFSGGQTWIPSTICVRTNWEE